MNSNVEACNGHSDNTLENKIKSNYMIKSKMNDKISKKISKFKDKISYDDKTIFKEINQDKKFEIEQAILHKNCKKKIILYTNIMRYILLISSTTIIFISANINNADTSKEQKILILIGGSLNCALIVSDKIINEAKKIIKKLKKKINNVLRACNKDINFEDI